MFHALAPIVFLILRQFLTYSSLHAVPKCITGAVAQRRLQSSASMVSRGRKCIAHATYKLALLPGDGIGPEITDEAVKVLKAVEKAHNGATVFQTSTHPVGGAGIDAEGDPLPPGTLEACLKSDAVVLGAVGGPKWDDLDVKIRPEQGLLRLRKALNLYANLRPIKLYDELLGATPLKSEIAKGTDILFVRELTGGIYFGERQEETGGVAWDKAIYSVPEVERIMRIACEAAARRSGKLVSVDKANVLASSRLWRKTAERVYEEEFKDQVELSHNLVDSMAMHLIQKPQTFDVILTENMFGDILSDEASVLAGSLGLLSSASLGDPGKPGMYEPGHGSAPSMAGQNRANPIATILSVGMLMRYSLRLEKEADAVDEAVQLVLKDGVRTGDLLLPSEKEKSKGATCSEMGDAIAKKVTELLKK